MINKNILKKLKTDYKKNKENKLRERLFNKICIVDLITDNNSNLNEIFNIEIETHGITNQMNSGRCWLFGGLNILREEVIKKCNLDNFELSGSYLAFYDKLERFNYIIENITSILLKNNNINYLNELLEEGISDGGYFSSFSYLVKKYGVVPKSIYQESFQSSDTGEINEILTRLIKKYYLEISKNLNNYKIINNKYLEYAYRILSNTYGEIVDTFDFEYKDINGRYHIDKSITPKDFYDKYIGINLDDYIEIYSYEDNIYRNNKMYILKDTSRIIGCEDNIVLNVSKKNMKQLLLKQLKNNELVYFSSSTPNKIINGIWIDTFKRYGDILDIDLELTNNDILYSKETKGEHVMIFTGVKLKNNIPIKWKIENSWGEKEGNKGYFISDDDWVNKYVFNIIINKKYLSLKQRDILKSKPISISKKNNKLLF